MRAPRSRTVGTLALAAFALACDRPAAPQQAAPQQAIPAALARDEAAAAARRSTEAGKKHSTPNPAPRSSERYAATNVLVAYAGAEKATAAVTRSKEEAKALAEKIYARVQAGEDLGALADEYSDGPERGHGGRLGVFSAAKMLPAISDTVARLAEGEIAPPVESPMGFHVLRRDKIEEIYLAEIVVAFAGAQNAPPEVARTRDEAKARAEEALAAARAEGAVFAEVVEKFSDHPTRARAGVVGRVFRGLLPPPLEALAFGLAPGEIGGPLEMPNGFTVLRRLPEATVRHVLVAYVGAARTAPEITRTKAEAAARAGEALEKLRRGDDFAAVARAYSDCPSKERGGDLGVVAEGTMTPRFERAVFALAPGERSGVIETEFGFHVMERIR